MSRNRLSARALVDPSLTIYQDSKVVATNEDWANSSAIATVAIQTGAFALPSGSKDAAVLLTLNPGAYTAQIKSGEERILRRGADRDLRSAVTPLHLALLALLARDFIPGRTSGTLSNSIGLYGHDGILKWLRWRELNRASLGLPMMHKQLINICLI
jgi:hypothetical protein